MGMTDPTPTRRHFRPTPSWLIFGLLVVEGLLWLSERYAWFWFNEKKGWTVLIALAVVSGAMLVMLGWFVAALVFRWRFQFSLRSLLALTVAVAVPLSWLSLEIKETTEQKAEAEEVVRLGGKAGYAGQVNENNGIALKTPRLIGPESLRHLLGDDFFTGVVFVDLNFTRPSIADLGRLRRLKQLKVLTLNFTDVTDEGLEQLKGLRQLDLLYLGQTRITDAGLKHLASFPQLKRLEISYVDIMDTGMKLLGSLTQLEELTLDHDHITSSDLAHIRGLKRLQSLYLDCNNVTDAGVAYIEKFRQLRFLSLFNNNMITDSGIEHLSTLTQLTHLYLGNMQVTDEGVKKLQQALPNCKIER